MKKFLILIVFLFLACASTQPAIRQQPQELKITVDSNQPIERLNVGGHINKSMEIKNDEGELSDVSFLSGNMIHMIISGGLMVYDYAKIEQDLFLIDNKYQNIEKVIIILNSPGGSAMQGLAISDLIEKYVRKGLNIEMHASGIVASAAVPIFAAGPVGKRYATPDTIFMVHEASMFKLGVETAKDIRAQHEMIELFRARYLSKLARKSNLSKEAWESKEGRTTWFSAEQAFEWGLVDKIE